MGAFLIKRFLRPFIEDEGLLKVFFKLPYYSLFLMRVLNEVSAAIETPLTTSFSDTIPTIKPSSITTSRLMSCSLIFLMASNIRVSLEVVMRGLDMISFVLVLHESLQTDT